MKWERVRTITTKRKTPTAGNRRHVPGGRGSEGVRTRKLLASCIEMLESRRLMAVIPVLLSGTAGNDSIAISRSVTGTTVTYQPHEEQQTITVIPTNNGDVIELQWTPGLNGASQGNDTLTIDTDDATRPLIVSLPKVQGQPTVADGGLSVTAAVNTILQLPAATSLAALSIHAGKVQMIPDPSAGTHVLELGTLDFTNTPCNPGDGLQGQLLYVFGQLDLGDATMILHSPVYENLRQYVLSGFNDSGTSPLWTGQGIMSSVASSAGNANLDNSQGLVLNAVPGSSSAQEYGDLPLYDSIYNVNVKLAEAIIKYTPFGDADLNGVVDDTDEYLQNNGFGLQLTGWFNGDFNYSGAIDDDDFFLANNGFSLSHSEYSVILSSAVEGYDWSYTPAVPSNVNFGTVNSWTVNFGDGTAAVSAAPNTALTHRYTDGPELFSVVATAHGSNGSVYTIRSDVQVADNAPTGFVASGASSATEGTPYVLTFTKGSDVTADPTSKVMVDWGDGNISQAIDIGTLIFDGSLSHYFQQSNSPLHVKIWAYNKDTDAVQYGYMQDGVAVSTPYIGVNVAAATSVSSGSLAITASDAASITVNYANLPTDSSILGLELQGVIDLNYRAVYGFDPISASGSNSYVISSLASDTTYKLRLVYSVGGLMRYAMATGNTTPSSVSDLTAPVPSIVHIGASTRLRIDWDPTRYSPGINSGFTVTAQEHLSGELFEALGTTQYVQTFSVAPTYPASHLFTLNNAALHVSGVDYLLVRVSYTDNGITHDSPWVSLSVPNAIVNPPTAPASATAAVIDNRTVRLSWLNTGDDETSYTVQREDNVGGAPVWTALAVLTADQAWYVDTGLAGGVQYDYRVVASNAAGKSANSNTASVNTPLITPTNLAAAATSNTTVQLNWVNEMNWGCVPVVERALNASFDGNSGLSQPAILPVWNQSTLTDTGLVPGTKYYYRMGALVNGAMSFWSNVVEVTTPKVVINDGTPIITSTAPTTFSLGNGADVPTIALTAVIRDFQGYTDIYDQNGHPAGHPDFESYLGDARGLVSPSLGADGTPVLQRLGNVITSAASFSSWFHDTPGINRTTTRTLTLTETAPGSGKYGMADSSFYPIDDPTPAGETFGNTPGREHDYGFTLQTHSQFTYRGGESLKFGGDDDEWVFINKKLAVDLGGIHTGESQEIKLDDLTAKLGIRPGGTYDFDLFFAERQFPESQIALETELAIQPNRQFSYQVTASNPDPNATLSYSLDKDSLALGMKIDSRTGLVIWNPGPDEVGDHPFTVTVSSSNGHSSSKQFFVAVNWPTPKGAFALTSQATSTSDIQIAWYPVPSATKYEVKISYDGRNFDAFPASEVPGDRTTMTITDVDTGFHLYIRVTAFPQNAGPEDSDTICATTELAAPGAPGFVQAVLGASAVTFSWTRYDDSETGFQLQRQINGGEWSDIGQTSVGVQTFIDSQAIIAANTYAYRVRAINRVNPSAWSDIAVAAPPTPPAPEIIPTVIRDYFITFYGAEPNFTIQTEGSNYRFVRNAIQQPILAGLGYDGLNSSAPNQPYRDFEGGDAFYDLLQAIDVNGDHVITKTEEDSVTVRMVGWSLGAMAAAELSIWMNDTSKSTWAGHYKLLDPIPVKAVVLLDPVPDAVLGIIKALRGQKSDIQPNVQSVYQFYQRRGGDSIIQYMNEDLYNLGVDDWTDDTPYNSSVAWIDIKGTPLASHALFNVVHQLDGSSDKYYNIENVSDYKPKISTAYDNNFGRLKGKNANHGTLVWYLHDTVYYIFSQ